MMESLGDLNITKEQQNIHSLYNQNETWLSEKGAWLTYFILVVFMHLVLLSIPFFDTATAWTMTNVIHNVGNYFLLHHVKGAPFQTFDQGTARKLTHWEQIDHGEMYTTTRKFLTLIPVVLFILASFYSDYNQWHFLLNFSTLALAVIPKLPQLYKVRLFGINKY